MIRQTEQMQKIVDYIQACQKHGTLCQTRFKASLPLQSVILFECPENYEDRKACFKITQRHISSVCHEKQLLNFILILNIVLA